MDFFARQDQARRRTAWLVAYFALGVALTVIAVYLVVALIFLRPPPSAYPGSTTGFWQPKPFAVVAFTTLAVIGFGSLYRLMQLSSGGRAVAESLGGVRLPPEPRNASERRLRNVVEEMALASGVPVPDIYVLPEEQSINAFAAGHTPSDAVIGVTRGCLNHLSRDELQGVIGHEFSHILNGDMRLNLRLMGVLFGLLCLAVIGRVLLYTRGRKNPLPLLGLALIVIGGIGVFFGRLIKSAISRQREFLADAAAVQFTRQPAGLVGALKKIAGLPSGSRLQTARAEEAAHLFFGNALASSWSRAFSTHPPILDRIRALDPSFVGPTAELPQPIPTDEGSAQAGWVATATPQPPPLKAHDRPLTAEVFIERAGRLDPHLLARASKWRSSLPSSILEALQTPPGATHCVMALLLAADSTHRGAQLQTIRSQLDLTAAGHVAELATAMEPLPAAARLPLADLCLPALRDLSPAEYATFRSITQALIEEDREIDLLEYALQKSLMRHLESHFGTVRRPQIRHRSLKPVARECETLLSVLSHVASSDPVQAQTAFNEGARSLNLPPAVLRWQPHGTRGLAALDQALEALNEVDPLQKRNVLYACARTVMADRQVLPREFELLRAIADALDCPVPPVVDAG